MSVAEELAEAALRECRAEECAVIVDEVSAAHLRWAESVLTGNGHTALRRVTVIAISRDDRGRAVGLVSEGGARRDDVRRLVRAAEQLALHSPGGPGLSLPGEAGMSQTWGVPAPEPVGAEALGPLARRLGGLFTRARAADRVLCGYAEERVATTYLATSSGLRLRHTRPTALFDLSVRDHSASGRAGASSWAGASTNRLAEIDVRQTFDVLEERLSATAHRIRLPTGRYEVLLPPSCVADLMVPLYEAANGQAARNGASVFSGIAIGQAVMSAALTLRSDPRAPGLECAPFVVARSSHGPVSVFDNGLELTATDWITDGRLTTLVHDRLSAEKDGTAATPHIGNLILEGPPGGRSLAEMVAATERGLLLTSLWYIREVDPRSLLLTGLTRDGVHLVEDGAIVGAVNDFRFNESPLGVLGRVLETGRTEPTLPREWGDLAIRPAMPALRVADFALTAIG